MILKRRLLVEAYGKGAGLGHVKIGTDGPRCSCGHHGCLEPNVTLNALARLTGIVDTDPAALLRLPDAVAGAGKKGDMAAVKAVGAMGRSLSIGVIGFVNVLNPGSVILGGPMRPGIEAALASIPGCRCGQHRPRDRRPGDRPRTAWSDGMRDRCRDDSPSQGPGHFAPRR